MKCYSYLRVSTKDQNTEKFKAQVIDYASRQGFPKPKFIEEKVSGKKPWRKRKLGDLMSQMVDGDKLITPELSRLGRSLRDVLDVLLAAKAKGIAVHAVKENMILNGTNPMQEAIVNILVTLAQLEAQLLAERTREGLEHARAKGVRLGRPSKSKLDKFREKILEGRKARKTYAALAEEFRVPVSTMRDWLKKNT
jgi:DNA invertase Pin-like site-specific DNA recombinase